jgi:lipoate synthase
MKATTETKVILELSLDQAKTLSSLAPNIGYVAITSVGGGDDIASKGAKLFSEISKVLSEARL